MNIDDMLYEEETLEDRYVENENLCIMLDERVRMSKVNQLDYKVTEIFGMTIIPYVLLLIPSIIYFGFSGIENLTSTLISNLVLGSAGISVPIGCLTSTLINKKYKTKKRFKDFSNSKKEKDKIELQLSNELQLEKTKNRMLALEKAIELTNTKNITDLSKYKNLDMSIIPYDLEKVITDRQIFLTELEKKYNELDLLSIKKYLSSNLCKYIIKGQSQMETFLKSFVSGIMPFLLIFMPSILVAKLEIPIPILLANVQLGVFGTSVISTTTYNLMKNRIQKKYFERINELLGDNKIFKEDLSNENNKIDELISKKIFEISTLEFKKEECEESLKTLGTEEEINKIIDCYFNSYSKQKEEMEINDVNPIYQTNIYEDLEKQKVKTLKK